MYVHTFTNETHSLAPLQDLIPTLANSIQSTTKVGIKSCRGTIKYVLFVYACMQ